MTTKLPDETNAVAGFPRGAAVTVASFRHMPLSCDGIQLNKPSTIQMGPTTGGAKKKAGSEPELQKITAHEQLADSSCLAKAQPLPCRFSYIAFAVVVTAQPTLKTLIKK